MEHLREAFEKKVSPEALTGCWLWTGALTDKGYGILHDPGTKRPVGAHRISYSLKEGSVPTGGYVLHDCDNRACVNPGHLFIGSASDNAIDMHIKGRGNQGHSKRGKPHLTKDQVAAIRVASGTNREVAAQYSCSANTVGYIRRGITHIL